MTSQKKLVKKKKKSIPFGICSYDQMKLMHCALRKYNPLKIFLSCFAAKAVLIIKFNFCDF